MMRDQIAYPALPKRNSALVGDGWGPNQSEEAVRLANKPMAAALIELAYCSTDDLSEATSLLAKEESSKRLWSKIRRHVSSDFTRILLEIAQS